MVERLEEVRKRSLIENEFFETATIEEDERKLAHFDQLSPFDQFGTHVLLSDGYRRLGRIDEAIEHLEIAVRLLEENKPRLTKEQLAEFLFQAGLTWLRLAESQNCVFCETGESCILPIRESGIHRAQVGSQRAIEYFERVLKLDPTNRRPQWPLNIAYMTLGKYPDSVPPEFLIPTAAFESTVEFPRFQEIGLKAGIKVVNCGGGGIAEDFDGDGLLDWMSCPWSPGGEIKLFRNRGDGTFDDISEAAGLAGIVGGINLVQGDFDNDGDADVYVTRGAWLNESGRVPNSLLENLGQGKFRDVTYDKGLGNEEFPTPTAAWSDFDNDGDLDLFVGNEGPPCQLYRNDGEKGFVDIAREAGVINDRFTKGVVWGDYNADRFPDLYVSNLSRKNRLYRNNQNGTFTDVAEELNVTRPMDGFPCWFWDVNNDGHLDIYAASYVVVMENLVKEMRGEPHEDEPDALYLSDGNGNFRDVAAEYSVDQVTMPMGANFGDLDNDGYLDFYLGTGYPGYEALMPNLMFHNRRGASFENVSYAGGFAHLQKSHGTAFADFDSDGDQDVFMQMGGAYPGDAFGDVLYENPGFNNHSVRIRLIGTTSNRSAIGARIRADIVEAGELRSVFRWVNSGGSFGCNSLEQHLGVGKAEQIDRVEIYWPTTDETQVFKNLPVDCRMIIREGSSEIESHPNAGAKRVR